MNKEEIYVGFDGGGTNFRGHVVNPFTGEIREPALIEVECKNIKDNSELTKRTLESLAELGSPENVKIGIVFAGNCDKENLKVIQAPNFHNIPENVTLPYDLKNAGYDIEFGNDMEGGTMGVVTYGIGKGIKNAAVVTVSSGTNFSIWADGNLIIPRKIEAGHRRFKPYSGIFCGCGGEGHLEPYVSGNGAATMAQQYLLIKGIPYHTILEEAVKKENEEETEKRWKRLKEDKQYRKKAFHKITAREVYDAYDRKPEENPQKNIRDIQVEAISHYIGAIVSDFSPLEMIVFMGSQTKDEKNLIYPAFELYRKNIEDEQMKSLGCPKLEINDLKRPGVPGSVAYYFYRKGRYNELIQNL